MRVGGGVVMRSGVWLLLAGLVFGLLERAPQVVKAQPADPGLAAAVVARIDRVIDGHSLDAYVDERRTAVAYLGARAPALHHPCGLAARERNAELAGGRVHLVEDPSLTADSMGRRVFYAYTLDGVSIESNLIGEGLAWAINPDAQRGAELAALQAEAQTAGRGCLWDGSTDRTVP